MAEAAATARQLQAESGLSRLEAGILLGQVLGVSRAWLLAHDTDPLAADAAARFRALAARRLAGEPVAYLLGEREFLGRPFQVGPGVLIPRPETELLVEVGLAAIADVPAPRVLDLGTGSGIVAVSIALARPEAEVWACDLSLEALAIAQANARALGATVQWGQGDWFAALPATARGAGFDLIVSNPPYIAADDHHLGEGDLRFEPRQALTDGADGLGALRQIVAAAPAWLRPGGALWLEHGWDQAAAVRADLAAAGWQDVASERDLAEIERVTGARSPAPSL